MTIDLSTTPYLKGDYPTWEKASEAAEKAYRGGYNSQTILARVAESIQKVRSGEAAFERDGVAFKEESYSLTLLTALFYVAAHEGRLNVLDFGGSLGSAYFQNRKLLAGIDVKWHVVEQENFVDYGQKNVPEIQFYKKVNDCMDSGINCILMSSVFAYVDEPYLYLNDLIALNAKYMILDRQQFNDEARDRVVLEYVPPSIYEAVYPAWLLDADKFLRIIGEKYDTILNWQDTLDRLPLIEGNTARLTLHGGWLFGLR